jgi:hypothetical protein
MLLLKTSSRDLSSFRHTAALAAAGALLAAPGGAFGQRKPPPAPAGAGSSQTYESLVNRPIHPVEWAPRPVVAARGGALVAILGGRVFASLDGGRQWAAVGNIGDEVVALAPVGADTWRCICRSGTVVDSRDDGRTWTPTADLGAVSGSPGTVIACGGFDPDGEGWAALDGPSSTVVASAGGVWSRFDGVRGRVTTGWRAGGTIAVLAGQDLYRMSVGDGSRFDRMSSLQGAALNAVVFVGAGRALIGADRGLVIETRDGGTTWLPRPAAGQATLEAIGTGAAFWAAGSDAGRGVLYASTDDARTWRRVLEAAAPLSRPIEHTGSVWLVDGAGAAWSAPGFAGPWRRVGDVERKTGPGPKPTTRPSGKPDKKKKGN